jgi:hypothetical protein
MEHIKFIKVTLKEIGLADVNWINLAQDRNKWRGRVATAMNTGLHEVRGISGHASNSQHLKHSAPPRVR